MEQLIKIFKTDDRAKRKEVATKAGVILLGVGLLAGIDYLLKDMDKPTNTESTKDSGTKQP